ncbi:MAG: hypothetical protein DHS20C20_03950 [Ardenticatenaceae bacterium]|nr:MAG: hypothetical protein DHS20C20_03950 [Ardenticatenaceae bacterium]
MKKSRRASSNLAVLRVFGGSLIALGLIFSAAWYLNRLDDNRFANGYRVEGTVERIHDGESPIVMVSFVDRNGRSQTWHLEKMTQSVRETLAEGDQVVAVQMQDSPSRIMLLDQIEARHSDIGGIIASALFLLPGLFLVMQRRPYGSLENQRKINARHRFLVGGSVFLFCGAIMLIGFFATVMDQNFHWIGKLIFGAFCLLTGGWMSFAGLGALWKAWRTTR